MSFAQLKGQQAVVELLQKSLARERLGHAYLFTGSEGGELETMARTLAQTLNCEQPPHRSPGGIPLDCCDRCPSCRRILNGADPDIHWIRPESKSRIITIDQIRDLMAAVHLKSREEGHKLGIIVAADRLNIQAANAFLKTLEEPPPKCVLVLLSTQSERLLETIFSRCLRLNFAGDQSIRLAPEALAWLTSFCEATTGAQKTLLNRYRLLGILQAKLTELKTTIEKNLTDRSPLEKYPDAEPSQTEKWEQELAAATEAEYRHQRTEILNLVQVWMRDIWFRTLGMGENRLAIPALVSFTEAIAARLSSEAALANLQVIEKTQRLLDTNVQEALALEVGLLKLQL